jgi:hypothetical protein
MARNEEPGQAKPRGKTSGSGKWTKYKPNAGKDKPSWAKVDEAGILVAIARVTEEGAALLFGVTRDGGALVLTICDGDERLKLYGTSTDEMGVHLREVADSA